MSNKATSEFGIRFVGDATSADAAASKTEASLKRVSATAQKTTADLNANGSAQQRMAEATGNAFQRAQVDVKKMGTELADAGKAAANGDWAGAARNVGGVGDAAGVARVTLVGFAATVAAVALSVTALYKAYNGGIAEVDNMNRAIELSGNYAGQTRSSMRALALEMSGFNSTASQSKETVTALAGSGLIASQAFGSVSRLVGEYASATNRSIDEVRPELIKLFADPARGAQDLNRAMHFLTAAELEHIETLQESGRAGEAQLLVSERLRDAVSKHETQLGLIDRALKVVKTSWSDMWDSAMGLGRPQTVQEKLEQARQGVEGLNMRRADHRALAVRGQGLASQLEAQLESDGDDAWVRSFKVQQEQNRIAWGELSKNYRTNAQKAADEMAKAKQLAMNSGMSLDDPSVKRVFAEIQEKYKDRQPKESDYDRLRERVSNYAAEIDLAAQKGDKLTQGDKLNLEVQRELTAAQRAQLQPLLEKIKLSEAAVTATKQEAQEQAALLRIQSLNESFQRDIQARRLQMRDMPALDRQLMLDQLAVEEKARQEEKALGSAKLRGDLSDENYRRAMDALTTSVGRQKNAVRGLYEEQLQLNSSWEAGASSGLTTYLDYSRNTFAQVRDLTVNAFRGMEDALANFVTTGKLDFRSLSESILADLARMQARALATDLFKGANQGGGLAGLIASWFGGGDSNSVMGVDLSSAAEDVFFDSGWAFAKGGAFSRGGDLDAYRNTVVSSPTLFRFAKGGAFKNLGLMGEEGEEAIMPLTRTSSGHLGVRSIGGGTAGTGSAMPKVDIYVTNQGTPQKYEKKGQEWDGEKLILTLVAQDIESNGPVGQAVARKTSGMGVR